MTGAWTLKRLILQRPLSLFFSHYRDRAEQRFVTLDVHVEGSKDEVEVDRDKVEQCLDLLLDNAIKFTVQYGEIVCTLTALGPRELKIDIRDTGIGIAQSDPRPDL